ncbi:MAG: chloride channel protein [Alphaproteobacteria bacterium]
MRPRLRKRYILVRLKRLGRNDDLVLILLALVIGVAAGAGSVLFREAILLVQGLVLGTWHERLHVYAAELPWWRILAATTLGGLAVGLYVQFVAKSRHPNGVAQVMEASALYAGRMSFGRSLHGALINAVSLGVGGSAGREGPVVHLGAAVGAVVAEKLALPRALARTLLACGVAAAVAASFNAPLAGVFFALEVVIGHYALSAFAPIVIASVVATIIARLAYGPFPAFIVPDYQLGSFLEFPAFALLGVTAAAVAIPFMRSIPFVQSLFDRTPLPRWSRPMVGGLLLGLLALVFPEVLGVGYGPTDDALRGETAVHLLFLLIAAKLVATAITLGSGFGGGMFSPSLFIGAMVGGAFGSVAGAVWPDLFSGLGAYAMVGMGAVAGAVMGAPISTILIIFELTADYELTTAVMVATVTATVMTRRLHGSSYFRWQLERAGIDLESRLEIDILRTLKVGRVMSRNYASVPRAMGLAQLRVLLQTAPYGELFVLTEDGCLYGTITLADLAEAAFDPQLDGLVNAGDVARLNPPMLQTGDDLQTAIDLMDSTNEEHIPVVDSTASRRLVGFVHERDIMLAYNKALVQLHREEGAAY